MKIFISFALLIISISYANVQETAAEQNNTRVSAYLHPFSTYSGVLGESPIYLTVEIPFSLSSSLVIRPSFLVINHASGDKAFRLGSDIGFRHYLARNGEGLYLQGQMGVFYYSHNNFGHNNCKYDNYSRYRNYSYYSTSDDGPSFHPFHSINIPRKSLWIDAMGYIGYSFKFSHISIFIDAGFGAVLGISTETGRVKLFDKPWPDFNIGIGIPF
ncbi:MAG: hypothetical protein LBH25_14685 [Fibromonadaceae bacterium]|jgi:hypothetical protein|nr:hypothetical protein [Fibromonadaceae bacterium]